MVGQPLTLGCSPQSTSSAKHICLCVRVHSSNWSAKVVECSELSRDFFIRLSCNPHVCVCVHSSKWSANPQLASSATNVCFVFKVIKASIDLFCARHVCVQKHTCVRPQQELVGQPWALGCNPHLPSFATETCVFVCAHSSSWSAKVVECSEPSLDFFIGLLCNTCVCSQQHLVGQPSVDLFCNTCVYVLSAARGLPKF